MQGFHFNVNKIPAESTGCAAQKYPKNLAGVAPATRDIIDAFRTGLLVATSTQQSCSGYSHHEEEQFILHLRSRIHFQVSFEGPTVLSSPRTVATHITEETKQDASDDVTEHYL